MMMAFAAVVFGLALLVWSADKFVDGSASTARYFGMPSLLIGMVIVGFGTSAPEMVVSALASSNGNPEIALGNAYGSNIGNIALILGISAIINPITVNSLILKKELPLLCLMTALTIVLILDYELTRTDAFILLGVFALQMGWTIWMSIKNKNDAMAGEFEEELKDKKMSLGKSLFWVAAGLIVLIISSRLLVWGAVEIAKGFGVSDLIIGLTIVAVGTSLPELASSIIAARKGEHDIALGNIVGSNLFNTLAVVGIAGSIAPLTVSPEILHRDMLIMSLLTVSIFVLGWGFKGKAGRINRWEGALLNLSYVAYVVYLIKSV